MPYPHQPGSIFFDGADAYEAYLNDKESTMKEQLSLAELGVLKQALRIAVQDKSITGFTSQTALDHIAAKIERMIQARE